MNTSRPHVRVSANALPAFPLTDSHLILSLLPLSLTPFTFQTVGPYFSFFFLTYSVYFSFPSSSVISFPSFLASFSFSIYLFLFHAYSFLTLQSISRFL